MLSLLYGWRGGSLLIVRIQNLLDFQAFVCKFLNLFTYLLCYRLIDLSKPFIIADSTDPLKESVSWTSSVLLTLRFSWTLADVCIESMLVVP